MSTPPKAVDFVYNAISPNFGSYDETTRTRIQSPLDIIQKRINAVDTMVGVLGTKTDELHTLTKDKIEKVFNLTQIDPVKNIDAPDSALKPHSQFPTNVPQFRAAPNYQVGAPAAPNITIPTGGIEAGDAPTFRAVAPTISAPVLPAAFNEAAPAKPTLAALNLPAPPNLQLPPVPTLHGVTLPSAPALMLPAFGAKDFSGPVPITTDFAFVEAEYNSTLKDTLRSKLEAFISGQERTGLSDAVQNAIWNRARRAENANAARKSGEAARMFASRGFAKPPGALAIEMMNAAQEAIDKSSSLNRDIMIKQAEMEVENRKWAFGQAWETESKLIDYTSARAARTLEAAKAVQEFAIQVYRLTLDKYNSDIQKYLADVEVYKAVLQSELSKLEIYKGQLEAAKLIGELQMQDVELYKARIEGAKAVIDVFKVEVESANVQAEMNKTIVQGYAAEISAYGEKVKAKAVEYNAFETQVRAEVAKIDIFKGQADAYNSEVEGFRTRVQALTAQKEFELKAGVQAPLDLYRANTDVYRAAIDAETGRNNTSIQQYNAEVAAYNANLQTQLGFAQTNALQYKTETDIKLANGQLNLDRLKLDYQKLADKTKLLQEVHLRGMDIKSQVLAGALASYNVSASMNQGYSETFSNNRSFSGAYNFNVEGTAA